MGEHTLVVTIEDDGHTSFKIECPHTGPDRPCACFLEGDHTQPCRCPEIGDGTRCGPCEDGDHYACEWGRNFEEVGAECQCDPVDECGYQVQIDNIGSEALDFGSRQFVLRAPVTLTSGGWEDPIEVKLAEQPAVQRFDDLDCPMCDGSGSIQAERAHGGGDVSEVIVGQCDACDGTGSPSAETLHAIAAAVLTAKVVDIGERTLVEVPSGSTSQAYGLLLMLQATRP